MVSAFTGGGQHVYMTTNFGANWNDISGNMPNVPVDSIALTSDGSTIYVGTDVGVYASTNGGQSWAVLGSGLPNAQVVEIAVVPSQHEVVVGTHGRGAWILNGSTGAVPTILSTNTTTFTVGTAGSFTVRTTGSPVPSLSITGSLPNGAAFTDNGDGTATLSNLPAVGIGVFTFTITAHNSTGIDATQTFILNVRGTGIAINPTTLPTATVGDAFQQQLGTTGGSGVGEVFSRPPGRWMG